MEGMELICFQLITSVGDARSSFIQAIREAKKGNIDTAREMIKSGKEAFTQGHHVHTSLVQEEAAGEAAPWSLLLVHAEDQLMSAEAFSILSEEFVDLYEILLKK